MAHLLKVSEWKDPTGKWWVADTSDLANDSAAWYHIARLLCDSIEDFIVLLKDKNAIINKWDPNGNNGKSLLTFYWTNYNDAHQFLLYVNRIARNKGWTIC